MKKLAKEINTLLLNNEVIKEYLELKKEIDNDQKLIEMKAKLDELRKKICKDKNMNTDEYYGLLKEYKSDIKIVRFEKLQLEIKEYFGEISDILALK